MDAGGTEESVEEGRLADVGLANESDSEGLRNSALLACRLLLVLLRLEVHLGVTVEL